MLLRSLLFVPAYNARFLENSIKQCADGLILDLEDSVPYEYKAQARSVLRDFLNREELKKKQIFIRLNSLESNMLQEDLYCAVHENVTGFMLSKVYTKDDIVYYDKVISRMEEEKNIAKKKLFLPLIETTSAVLDIYGIAKSSDRIVGLAFGGEDYLNDLHGIHGESSFNFDFARMNIALAARATGVLPIDTPWLDLHDKDGFEKEKQKVFEMGFEGTLLIHPNQIEDANKLFEPTEEEVQLAYDIVGAIRDAEKRGTGVAMLNGKMIGPPMRKRAEHVIELVKRISAKK